MQTRNLLPLLLLSSAAAHANVQFSSGVDYAQGKYGGTQTTEQTTVPLSLKFTADRLTLKASVPYVWIRNVNPGARGEALPCGNSVATPQNVDGFGDVVTSASYSIIESGDWLVDVGGKAKWATGDTEKCLSSGENDYSALVDVVKRFGAMSVFTTAGWTKKGDPEQGGITTDYQDPFFGSAGVSYKLSGLSSVGASYDYREALTATSDPIREASVFLTHKLGSNLKLQVYAVTGFTDASADIGGGSVISVAY